MEVTLSDIDEETGAIEIDIVSKANQKSHTASISLGYYESQGPGSMGSDHQGGAYTFKPFYG